MSAGPPLRIGKQHRLRSMLLLNNKQNGRDKRKKCPLSRPNRD
jgi:hypothetical protein